MTPTHFPQAEVDALLHPATPPADLTAEYERQRTMPDAQWRAQFDPQRDEDDDQARQVALWYAQHPPVSLAERVRRGWAWLQRYAWLLLTLTVTCVVAAWWTWLWAVG